MYHKKEYNLKLINYPSLAKYDSIIIAVAHDKFKKIGISKIRNFAKKKNIVFDIKCLFDKNKTDLTL